MLSILIFFFISCSWHALAWCCLPIRNHNLWSSHCSMISLPTQSSRWRPAHQPRTLRHLHKWPLCRCWDALLSCTRIQVSVPSSHLYVNWWQIWSFPFNNRNGHFLWMQPKILGASQDGINGCVPIFSASYMLHTHTLFNLNTTHTHHILLSINICYHHVHMCQLLFIKPFSHTTWNMSASEKTCASVK